MALLVVFLLSVVVGRVTANSAGPPASACSTLTPGHPGSSQSSTVPYVINMDQFSDGNGQYWYTPGQTYTRELTYSTSNCLDWSSAYVNREPQLLKMCYGEYSTHKVTGGMHTYSSYRTYVWALSHNIHSISTTNNTIEVICSVRFVIGQVIL